MKPQTRYKLTNQRLQTHGGCQWILGEWKETKRDRSAAATYAAYAANGAKVGILTELT